MHLWSTGMVLEDAVTFGFFMLKEVLIYILFLYPSETQYNILCMYYKGILAFNTPASFLYEQSIVHNALLMKKLLKTV